MPRFAANLSTMFTEQPFIDRFAAARRAGFSAVECQFPYEVAAEELKVRASGASLSTLGGSAGRLILDGTGASTLHLDDLVANDATTTLRGASNGTVNVTGKLDVDLRGASTLYYLGSPKLGQVTSVEASTFKQR